MRAPTRLRTLLALALLAGTALAGCADGPDEADPGYLAMDELAAAPPFGILLCKGGFRLAGNVTERVDDCNHRVTKPLLDNRSWDWQGQHGPANEVSVAVDPTDPLRVAGGAKDYTVSYLNGMLPTPCGQYTVWMGVYWSTDGGVTWGNDLMPGFPGDRDRPSPLSGNACNTDPVAVFGTDGTFYFSGLNYDGSRAGSPTGGAGNPLYPGGHDLYTGSQIYVARSHDGGATFPGEEMGFCAVGDDGLQFNDKQWFAVQPGGSHLIVTWTPYFSTPAAPSAAPDPTGLLPQAQSYISYCESTDGGLTWGPQRLFHPGTALPVNSQFSMPAYLPPGGETQVAVIWAQDDDPTLPPEAREALGTASLLAYTEGRITPQGTVFEPILASFPMNPLKSSPGRDGTGPTVYRVATYPVLAVDTSEGPHKGRRYVVWADQEGPVDSDVQLLLRHSDDGRTWSEPVAVNDDPAGDQYMPWIDVDAQGGVHVAWYDRRHDPENRRMDVYHAYSSDGGATFRNVRVTERSFDGDLGHHQGGFPFIGDYIGLDASNETAVISWADTRHTGTPGRPAGSDVYSATLVRDAAAAQRLRELAGDKAGP